MLELLCVVIVLGMVCRFVTAIQKKNPVQVWWFALEMLAFAIMAKMYL